LAATSIECLDLARVRHLGAAGTAQIALERLSRPDLAGFWIHLDVDVLDDAIMPAVDYRQPGGLSLSELEIILGAALDAPGASGVEITIFNPALDPTGEVARTLVRTLGRAFGSQ
jgi:arginase